MGKNKTGDGITERTVKAIDYLRYRYPKLRTAKAFMNTIYHGSEQKLSQWRAGTYQPVKEHLADLVNKYGISGTWLLTGKGEMLDVKEHTQLDEIQADIKEIKKKLSK